MLIFVLLLLVQKSKSTEHIYESPPYVHFVLYLHKLGYPNNLFI